MDNIIDAEWTPAEIQRRKTRAARYIYRVWSRKDHRKTAYVQRLFVSSVLLFAVAVIMAIVVR